MDKPNTYCAISIRFAIIFASKAKGIDIIQKRYFFEKFGGLCVCGC